MTIKDAYDVLLEHWGYAEFRYPQKEIISSVLDKKHTLAIMPTGGGKSLCYQVPGLLFSGTTLVITPLIALMLDQVQGLKARNIRCDYLHSGLSYRDIKNKLELAVAGHYKFLFISPERLQSVFAVQYLRNMNISLLVIDEAHCISEWGYDFRPSYLRIASAHEHIGNPPVLALTATATPDVELDILRQLELTPYNIIRAPLKRVNLVYTVIHSADKLRDLRSLLEDVSGSAIVYVNSRRGTERIAYQLKLSGFSADFYHAGVDGQQRNQKQESWINNKLRIMVATNAFGMGIDKPDVRLVVHMLTPSSIESYYQEAGRAGRDGLSAQAVLLYDDKDKLLLLDQYRESYPSMDFVKRVYKNLAIESKVGAGPSDETWYPFKLEQFAEKYRISARETYYALNLLVDAGVIILTESYNQKNQVQFIMNRNELYHLQLKDKKLDVFTKQILRLYEGLFSELVPISEFVLARSLKVDASEIKKYLEYLQKQKIVEYRVFNQGSQVQFVDYRYTGDQLNIDQKKLTFRKERHKKRVAAILDYATELHCREQFIVEYLGDPPADRCGRCDFCLAHHRVSDHDKLKTVLNTVRSWYSKYSKDNKALEVKHVVNQHKDMAKEDVLDLLLILELDRVIKIESMQYIYLGEAE